jgi:hypothetical protein
LFCGWALFVFVIFLDSILCLLLIWLWIFKQI